MVILRYMLYNVFINFGNYTKELKHMKTLDLAMNWKGGLPAVYARNMIEHGDYPTVAFIVGSTRGELKDNGKYLIDICSSFNKPEYLNQVKAFLKGINDSISFANDQPSGCFLEPEAVLQKASEQFKLMNFEKRMILDNKNMLHTIYVSAIKHNKKPELPQEFEYQVMSGGLYPIRQVYRAICELI